MSKKEKSDKFSGGETKVKSSWKIWKKWWFWALIVAALIGGVIEYMEPEETEKTEENKKIETLVEKEKKGKIEETEDSSIEIENKKEGKQPIDNKEIENKKEVEIKQEEKKDISGFQLISMEGHPVLYDYLSEAHTFWDNYAEERIDFGDDVFYNFESGKTVLVIDTYLVLEHALDEHMIRKFDIYPDIEISLDEGLNLAKSYVPIDIMKKWYTLERNECYHFKENNSYEYLLFYKPTEKGKEIINQQKLDYNYVEVILHLENDIVTTIHISSTSTSYHNKGEYELQDWHYNFLE